LWYVKLFFKNFWVPAAIGGQKPLLIYSEGSGSFFTPNLFCRKDMSL